MEHTLVVAETVKVNRQWTAESNPKEAAVKAFDQGLFYDKCNQHNGQSFSPLLQLVDDCRYDEFVALADTREIDINLVDCGHTALTLAIRRNQNGFVEYILLRSDCNPNLIAQQLMTPLTQSVCSKNVLALRWLLNDERVEINEEDSLADTVFSKACRVGSTEMLKLVLSCQQHKPIDTALPSYRLASYNACRYGYFDVAKVLISSGHFTLEPYQQHDPIAVACKYNQAHVLQLMLRLMPTLRPGFCLRSEEGQEYLCRLLHMSSHNGSVDATRALLLFIDGESETTVDAFYRCCHAAVKRNNIKIGWVLLERLLEHPPDGVAHAQHVQQVISASETRSSKIHRVIYKWWIMHRTQPFSECLQQIFPESWRSDPLTFTAHELYYCFSHRITDHVTEILQTKPKAVRQVYRTAVNGIALFNLSRKHLQIAELCRDLDQELTPEQRLTQAKYAKWYEEVRFSYKILPTSDCRLKGDPNANDVIKAIIASNPATVMSLEMTEVKETIHCLFERACERLGSENPLFRCFPRLLGSAREESKSYMPDEFDYILVFALNDELVDIKHIAGEFYNCSLHVRAEHLNNPQVKPYIDHGNRFNMKSFVRDVYDVLERIVLEFVSPAAPARPLHHNLHLEPNFFQNRNVSHIVFKWRGNDYKDMTVKVDIVPGLEFKHYRSRFDEEVGTQVAMNAPTRTYVVYKHESLVQDGVDVLPLSFSDAEYVKFSMCSPVARHGYKLSKAMRIMKLLPMELISDLRISVYSIEDYLPTYFLKMCLFYCWDMIGERLELTEIQWTLVLYVYLKDRLERHGALPNYFKSASYKYVDKVFECTDDITGANPDHVDRACCVKRRNLIRIVSRIIAALEQYCETENISTQFIDIVSQERGRQ